MGRVFSEGSGKGAQTQSETILSANDAGTIQLPEGVQLSSFEMTRDGQDLVLTAPDGSIYVVENYFIAADAPLIVSADGALLTPALVQSFLKSDARFAAVEQTNDQSPVGEVTEVSGNATVTHADGTKEPITAGTQIFEGDIIETDEKGAVNIQFADESTFAVSENARLAVDDFSFNPDDQSGTTGLSILRGVFMFTSGLIGRENPDAVTLETPVGSIGIRGTIIGGNIQEGGESQISVIEGAIVVRNGTGEQILSGQFETVQLTGFNAPITNIGTLDAGQMTQSYGAVRSVASSLFTSIDDTARDGTTSQGQQQNNAPEGEKPAADTQTQPQSQQDNAPAGDTQPAAEPKAEAAPAEPAPAQTTVLAEPPVFQELNTGSNLNSGPNAPSTANLTPPSTTAPLTVTTTPSTPPATLVTTTTDTVDRRAPSPATFTSGGTVAEESSAGTFVGTVGMTGTLPVGVTYSLIANPGNLFVIDGVTGAVSLASQAGDYDTGTTSYNLGVRIARNDTGQFTDTNLTVGVTNIDEAPTFGNAGTSVDEGVFVTLNAGMIGATDPEGSTALTYTVTAEAKGQILVNGVHSNTFTQSQLVGGLVKYQHNGDEPGSGAASFTLTATDSTGHTSAAKVVPVTVNPQNDAPVQAVSAGGTIQEDEARVIDATMLNWTDADANSTASQLVYTISTPTGGVVERQVSANVWQVINGGGTFTQQDILDGNIRFQQTGEGSSGSFNYSLTDGFITTARTGTMSFGVNNTNDAPTGLSFDNNTANFNERPALGAPSVGLGALTINDAEFGMGGQPYTFSVERFDGGSWVADNSRFEVFNDAGTYRIIAKANVGFDHGTHMLRVKLTDGSHTAIATTNQLTVTINDVDQIATDFTLNEGARYNGTFDAVVSGKVGGAWIGTLGHNDTDGGLVYNAADYEITGVSGGGLGISNFIVSGITMDDGSTSHVLKLAGTTPQNFGNDTISVTVKLDANKDGIIGNAGDVTKTFTLLGRNDTMVLENVNGKNGFTIKNDIRFGGVQFGASVAVGDFNAGGAPDLVIGAPFALNGSSVLTGGAYAAHQGALMTDAVNGEILLSGLLTNANPPNIFFQEPSTTGRYGTKMVSLSRFDGNASADIAIANPGNGTVEIIRDGNPSNTVTINGIPTGGLTGDALSNAITLASLGDINGDGYSDLLVGALKANSDAGEARILFGNSTPGSMPFSSMNINLSPESTGSNFGSAAAGLGDINGDGYADFAVSAANADAGAADSGRVSVYFGGQGIGDAGLNSSRFVINGVSANGHLGSVLAGAGDFNGDGLNDLMIRESTANGGRGSVHLVFGDNDLGGHGALNMDQLNIHSNFRGVTLNWSGAENVKVGNVFSRAGDFNGDGYDDVVVDVSRDLGGGEGFEHMLYVLYGSANPFASYDLKALTTDAAKAYKIRMLEPAVEGITVTSAGDLNLDGFDDIVIGNPGADDDDGSVTVVYGGSYDDVTQTFLTASTAVTNGSYATGTGAQSLTANNTGVSFRAGDGDDIMTISVHGAVRNYDGGRGNDTLKLFFSGGEVSDETDLIDLRGLGARTNSVEIIEFAGGSRQDTVQLDIQDIISMATSNASQKLYIKVLDVAGAANTISIFDEETGNAAGGLASLRTGLTFINDDDGIAGQDTRTESGVTYFVYTHQATGAELLVDNRIANAGALA